MVAEMIVKVQISSITSNPQGARKGIVLVYDEVEAEERGTGLLREFIATPALRRMMNWRRGQSPKKKYFNVTLKKNRIVFGTQAKQQDW